MYIYMYIHIYMHVCIYKLTDSRTCMYKLTDSRTCMYIYINWRTTHDTPLNERRGSRDNIPVWILFPPGKGMKTRVVEWNIWHWRMMTWKRKEYTLANYLNCERKSIKELFDRLVPAFWINWPEVRCGTGFGKKDVQEESMIVPNRL